MQDCPVKRNPALQAKTHLTETYLVSAAAQIWKPKLSQFKSLVCQPEHAQQAKSLTPAARNLSHETPKWKLIHGPSPNDNGADERVAHIYTPVVVGLSF